MPKHIVFFLLYFIQPQDPDIPLTYQFSYKTNPGLYTVVAHGSEHYATTVLPPGKNETDGYGIDVEIKVIDSLSAATSDHLLVQVGFMYF